MSACPACRASSSIRWNQTHRTDHASMSVGFHGAGGTGTAVSGSALRTASRTRAQTASYDASAASIVSCVVPGPALGVVGVLLLHRPVVDRAAGGGQRDLEPVRLGLGDVLEQRPDGEGARRRRGDAGLGVAQAVDGGTERVLLLDEVGDEGGALVGHGWRLGGHQLSFRSGCGEWA